MPENKPLFSLDWSGTACGVNDRYAGKRSKVLSPEYRTFKASLAGFLQTQTKLRDYTGKLLLSIRQTIGASRDADSLIKPLFDSLESSNLCGLPVRPVIKNDKQIRAYSVMCFDKPRGAPDHIRLKAYPLETMPEIYSPDYAAPDPLDAEFMDLPRDLKQKIIDTVRDAVILNGAGGYVGPLGVFTSITPKNNKGD